MTEGSLLIRDAAEAAEILLPTTVSGTNTDGQLSDVNFSTPTISFRQDVPTYGTYADIDAAFSTVGAGSGTINENGDVTVNIAVTVDLHIVVPILTGSRDCRATPINLTLLSTAPYDGETVTLAAPNFTVPEVSTAQPCDNLVGPAVNEALAGAGHAITMTFAGDLTVPVAGEPTTTSLTMSPEAGLRVGQEATVTATVAPEGAIAAPDTWAGSVTFYDGATNLGTVDVAADGTASLATTSLPAGTRRLRAAFSGAPPDWRPSSSPVLPYVVEAAPLVSTDLAGGIVRGTERDFTVSLRNTDLGAVLEETRLDVSFGRTVSASSLSSVGLAHVVDGTPVPLALSGSGSQSQPRIGTITGDVWRVPPGAEATETLRLTVPAGVGPGPVRFTFSLVTVEDGEDVVLSTATAEIVITAADRFPTTLTAGQAGSPGFPPVVPATPAIAPVTPVVRQGTVAEVFGLIIGPVQGQLTPRGTVSFSIGGRPVLARQSVAQSLTPWVETVVLPPSTGPSFHLVVPEDMAAGATVVQVRYSGDDVYAGSTATWPITIQPGLGEPYDCAYGGYRRGRFVANLEMQAQVAPVGVRGDTLPVARVTARLHVARTRSHTTDAVQFAAPTATYGFALTGGGTGTFGSFAQTGETVMDAAGTAPVNWTMSLGSGVGTLPVAHAAGTTEPIRVEGITIDASSGGFLMEVNCVPFGEAAGMQVASVLSTGTSLVVEPGEGVRQGEAVELTAEALPASPGVVEFLDGETTVGVSPVDGNGVARITVDDLPPGPRSLTARYFGTVYPDSTSDPVELAVDGIDCFGLAEPGTEAVVRLIYLTVLGRCPDQGGFDFWVARLDGGATRESVANAIANSHEARKVLVDEAYGLMLDRRADTAGREHWATRLGRTGSYRDLIGNLGASPEFRTRAGGTDADVVNRLYARLLGRSPSAADQAWWADQLRARGAWATTVRMFDLDEPLRTLVTGTYRMIIDRAPAVTERDAGVALMRSRSDRAALNALVINTNDFYTRAQGFPNR